MKKTTIRCLLILNIVLMLAMYAPLEVWTLKIIVFLVIIVLAALQLYLLLGKDDYEKTN